MSALNNSLLLGAPAGAGGYSISRSLRFNAADSSFLSRTPASAGNRKTWTWAGWVKRSKLGTQQNLFHAGVAGVSDDGLFLSSGDAIILDSYGVSSLTTSQVFRDPSAWYHIVWTWDTDNATSSDRSRLYVNGPRVTAFSSASYPGSGATSPAINNTTLHTIGSHLPNFVSDYPDAYLADVYFIDGQALDPTSFGEFSATTGVWVPKKYSGPTPTGNSFWLPFSDNSAATATTLGKDNFNLGNNWLPNNLSVTAGAGNDSLIDVPVNGSEVDTGLGNQVRGNYATLNPLTLSGYTSGLENGNLYFVGPADGYDTIASATIAINTGKWYWEVTAENSSGTINLGQARGLIGIKPTSFAASSYPSHSYASNGQKFNGATFSSYGAAINTGDIIGVALDLDAGTLTFYRNGVSQGTAFASLASNTYAPCVVGAGNGLGAAYRLTLNFGQRPFAYPVAGHKSLNTASLPASVVTKPSTVFDVKLYTGNGGTQTISGLGFSPDFLWIKARSNSGYQHVLQDVVRGAGKSLFSSLTSQEIGNAGDFVGSFNSDGFSVTNNYNGGTAPETNGSGSTYAAWCWDAGNTTVTNTQGSITSQVRANASAGFSIITFTTQSSGTATVGHGLGVAPEFFIIKARGVANNWWCYHKSLATPQSNAIALNLANAALGSTTLWNNTAPTSSVISFSSDWAGSNTVVVYAFAPLVGYSSMGSYVGNGSVDGPFVFCNFRPRWIMIKDSSSGSAYGNWMLKDALRPMYNTTTGNLYANATNAEDNVSTVDTDILSNGFKLRGTYGGINTNGVTYIYAAFAESPFAANNRAR